MSVGSGTYGALLFLGILAGFSLLADSRAAVLGVCAVGTFLLIRYAVASRRFATVAAGLKVTRELEKAVVRQDSTVCVRVLVGATLAPGCRAEVEDLPPAGVQVVGGSTRLSLVGPTPKEAVISYQMIVPTEGEVVFRGFMLGLPDPFFPMVAMFGGRSMHLPMLMVRPERRFITQNGEEQGDTGPESRHVGGGTGGTVRSFREFVTGDDVRRIDWKVSAKRDSLYVRVCADEEDRAPLIFVDLPKRGASQHARIALKEAVRSAVAASVQTHGRASLMAVRGPNLLVYLPLEADYARAMQTLAESENTIEEAYFYRARTPSSLWTDLNAIVHRPENGNGNGNGHTAGPDYRERLSAIYGSVLKGREQTIYERQVAQAVWRLRPRRIELFSCRDGDQSHLDFVICIAERAGVQVDLWKQNGHSRPESAGWNGNPGDTGVIR